MNHAGTLGITALTAQEAVKCGNQSSTDIDTHDDGVCTREIQRTGNSQGLQHGNGSGRRLNNHGQNHTGKDTHDGLIGHTCQQFQERRIICKALNSAGHIHQTNEQNTKTHANIANGLGLAALDKHNQHNANEQCNRCQRICVKQPQQPVIATVFNECQGGNPCSHSSTNIGTHNDGYSLLQVQDTCANQRNSQNDGSSGTLNNSSYQRTGQNTHDNITGNLFQDTL